MAQQQLNESHKKAWEWAQEKGLLNRTTPRKSITREQIATVFHEKRRAFLVPDTPFN
ncbi:hypothetical protein [Salibacterium sp. K-3]